jgi:hypothetical protein
MNSPVFEMKDWGAKKQDIRRRVSWANEMAASEKRLSVGGLPWDHGRTAISMFRLLKYAYD